MANQSGFKFDLGDEVKDKVTGYVGIVICRTEFLNACRRYTIQAPKTPKAEKVPDALGLDEDNMILLKAKKVLDKLTKPTGGDQKMPSRAADPRR